MVVGPPLPDIKTIFGGGAEAYTNSIDTDASGSASIGDEVRTVSFELLASDKNLSGALYIPMQLPDLSSLIAVGVLKGSVTGFDPGSGGAIVTFTSGRIYLVSDPLGTFDPEVPSTVPAVGTAFAEFALKPQEEVVATTSGFSLNLPAALTNISTPDGVNPLLSQAVLLFREDSTVAQNTGATPGSGAGTGGDNFISNVDDVSPAGSTKTDEGFVSIVDQTVENLDLTALGLGAADLVTLDSYYTAGVGVVFATALGAGASTNFDPFPGGVSNGDFRAQFSSENYIGHQYETDENGWGGIFPTGTDCDDFLNDTPQLPFAQYGTRTKAGQDGAVPSPNNLA